MLHPLATLIKNPQSSLDCTSTGVAMAITGSPYPYFSHSKTQHNQSSLFSFFPYRRLVPFHPIPPTIPETTTTTNITSPTITTTITTTKCMTPTFQVDDLHCTELTLRAHPPREPPHLHTKQPFSFSTTLAAVDHHHRRRSHHDGLRRMQTRGPRWDKKKHKTPHDPISSSRCIV